VTWVVDASIAVKWVIPEVLSDVADRLRESISPSRNASGPRS
jgi:hypothetical protein